MESTSDLFLLLSLPTDFYVSKPLIKKLYESHKDLLELFSQDMSKTILSKEDVERIEQIKVEIKKYKLDEIKKSLEKNHIGFIALCDNNYPLKLKEINDSPLGLFYKGNLNILKEKSVAIVGTRAATNYGINISKKIASLLAEQNLVIISGLASGIDTSAHIGAVKSGKTIAVLGTGVDIAFPYTNKELYKEILEKGGLIVSEYPPGSPGLPWNFPQRNRIISALSDAVVVIEGDVQSGAMITAKIAIKHGKPLFALPGPIDSPVSNGPNVLIKSGAAELLTSVNDILEKIGEGKQVQLDLKNNDTKLEELNEKQKNIYKLLSTAKSFDTILLESSLNISDLVTNLSILELRGFVQKMADGNYLKL